MPITDGMSEFKFIDPRKACVILASGVLAASACRHGAPHSSISNHKSDGVVQVVLADAWLTTWSASKELWLDEIRNQVAFAVGVLAGLGAVADLDRLEISVDESGVRKVDGRRQVPFAARLRAIWPESTASDVTLALPLGGDVATRDAFYRAYGASCVASDGAAQPTISFWHRYRPGLLGCPLRDGEPDKRLTVRTRAQILPTSPEGAPDYGGLWADGKLTAVVLAGSRRDFEGTLAALTEVFGAPQSRGEGDASFGRAFAKGEAAVRLLWVGPGPLSIAVKAVMVAASADVIGLSGDGTLRSVEQTLATALPESRASRFIVLTGRDTFAYASKGLVRAIAAGRVDVVAEALPGRRDDAAGATVATVLAALAEAKLSHVALAAKLAQTSPQVAVVPLSK